MQGEPIVERFETVLREFGRELEGLTEWAGSKLGTVFQDGLGDQLVLARR